MSEAALLAVARQRLTYLEVPEPEVILGRLSAVLTELPSHPDDEPWSEVDDGSSDGDPGALGRLRWQVLSERERKSEGAFFTPPDVAAELATASIAACMPASVCDPSVGGGAFLLATADAMVAAGASPEVAFEAQHGIDVDAVSVEVTRFCLGEWAFRNGLGWLDAGERLVVADSLLVDPWPFDHVDLIVGNPPFAGQLRSLTVHDRDRAAALKERFGEASRPYTDAAALFLLLASQVADQVTLVLPRSLLAARDAANVRAQVSERMRLTELWLGHSRDFRASVQLCALRLEADVSASALAPPESADNADTAPRQVTLHAEFGGSPLVVPSDGWSALSARAAGVPSVEISTQKALSDIAHVTADFRDEYYALSEAVEEDIGQHYDAKLVTSGLIDPAHLRWGEISCRFGRKKWLKPVVQRAGVSANKQDWFDRRLRPKVLVASQTPLIEAVVDVDGELIPSTPVVTIETDQLWHVAALLSSPVASAQLMAATAGTAQSSDAMRVSASSLKALSLPQEQSAWDEAADLMKQAHRAEPLRRRELLVESADVMFRAYRVQGTEELRGWWLGRLPSVR